MKRIILASASPRRKQLLESIGYIFDIIPPTVCESIAHDRYLSPNEVAEQLATLKASSIASQLSEDVVIGADTIVFLGDPILSKADCRPKRIARDRLVTTTKENVEKRFCAPCSEVRKRFSIPTLGGEILGKPEGRDGAIAILTKLSGTRHAVITGVCVIDAEHGTEIVGSDTTWITMAQMSHEQIEAYVDSGEAIGKAGAYAIQETGDRYVKKIEGSFSNVVGLPLELLKTMMAKMSVS